ncbi:AI-2E family transporter [Gloeothece verrucosa]|uniref:AI-2E family transporter n=1 Tax=Gloeothece verrucosa (strain PCC 7822) TaxID=497965 RepID=E0U9L8_GLOV7|nr:AI-2E family transporter [Gloeothece verrucosa]ADN13819.1 protein of unknown function UPF0118 [Gloeothece verrucosa PCC 7822]
MTTKPLLSPIFLLLLGGASFVIIVAGMQAAASILNSFFLASLIAIAITPLLHWLIRKRLPGWLALLMTILIVICAGLFLVAFLGISISELIHILPTYEAKIQALKDASKATLAARGIDTSQLLSLEIFSPARIIGTVAGFLRTITEALSTSLLLVFLIAFMLIEASGFSEKIQRNITSSGVLLARFNAFNRDIRNYVFITAWTGALTGVVDFFILLFLGIDLAALWGVLFFLLNFIPAVGFILAVLPPMLLALLEFGIEKALLVFFFCWLIDNIVDKGIKPRYMQQGLDLSPLIIILSVIFWSWVLGGMGAILAVPLTLMVKKVILESSEDTRFLVVLMGSGNAAEVKTTQTISESESDHLP